MESNEKFFLLCTFVLVQTDKIPSNLQYARFCVYTLVYRNFYY